MRWLAGPRGGGWYAMVEGLAKLVGAEEPSLGLSVAAGGGRENPLDIERGKGELGMSIDFLVAAAAEGKPPYEGAPMMTRSAPAGRPCPSICCGPRAPILI